MPVCRHCLIEFPASEACEDASGRVFCCKGCLEVFRFINQEGLGAFYDRRDWDAPGIPGSPRAGVPEAIDTSAYLESVRETDAGMEADIYLDGLRCASCVWLVERVLERTGGVLSARVNYATHRVRLRWDSQVLGLEALLGRIYSTGYVPKPYSQSEAQRLRQAETRDLLVRFGTAGFLSSQLMIYSVALYAGYFQGMDPGLMSTLEVIAMGLT
ncbi:MAG: heavy metal translocating P-type ATPase metal-binding domain-containing protein, partial [Thermodesulfovibrionales bacterium]|nr:heavy metal translocating P-type ATPase metal-binding domain-containing protein [Thermodesulfovibrionales bacterium]